MKKRIKSIIAVALALVVCIAALTGCTSNGPVNTATAEPELFSGGVICLKVNPEIAIAYDADGNVTSVTARNDDGIQILETYSGYEGKECRTVVAELVEKIGEAGYFVEEIEGQSRQITIEIESGSILPNNTFLDDVAEDIRVLVNTNDWHSPVDVRGESDYGITDYIDTDYGPDNDGVTDYYDTDYGVNNDGVTDYNNTDYGPNNDGVTDYDDTDYGPNNDGVTDYTTSNKNNSVTTGSSGNSSNTTSTGSTSNKNNTTSGSYGNTDYYDTDYGPNNDGVTDYNDTDYGPNNDGVTDYDDTDYGPNNDGVTDYNDTDYGPNNDGVTDYRDSNYGNTNYNDSGYSNYD